MALIPTDSTVAIPLHARLRSIRRMAACLIIVLLLVVRLIWGHYTAAALHAEVAQLRARGEPLYAADFAFVDLSDNENAAKYLMDAARAFAPNALPPRTTNLSYGNYPPYGDRWMAASEASERAHGNLFALAREARRHPRAQWKTKPLAAPLTAAPGLVNTLNASRNLANILGDGAEYAHFTGDDVEALARLRDILHLARSLRQDETLIASLVGIGIDALACSAAMSIAPGLRFDDNATPGMDVRGATREIIADLLDEAFLHTAMAQSFRFERAMTHEMRQSAGADTWVIRPLADVQLVREHRNFDIYIEAAALPNKPQVTDALARLTREQPNAAGRNEIPRYSRWFGMDMYVDRYFETWFRVTAERRMTAVSLAVQMFRADHGRWPNALGELVPQYLPAVPLDPFTDGKPLGYVVPRGVLPGGGDRPLVFHTGGDLDAGPYPEPSYSWEGDRRPGVTAGTRKDLWQYRDLARFVPATQPASTQAVDDQP